MIETSLLALIIGPIIYHLFRNDTKTTNLLNEYVGVLILSMVFFEIMNNDIDYLFIILFLVGVLGPFLTERYVSKNKVHEAMFAIVVPFLSLHAMVDGIALSEGSDELKTAIILHRVPMSAALWYSAKSYPVRIGILSSLFLFTIIGYNISNIVKIEPDIFHIFEAFILGSLLHVLVFSHGHKHESI